MKKNYIAILCLTFWLTACESETQKNFLCSNAQGESIKFTFDEEQVSIDDLVFYKQRWIVRKVIEPNLVQLVWRQKIMLPVLDEITKKNNFYDAQIVRDYQFNTVEKKLYFAYYLQDVPQKIALAHEKETSFSCQKLDLLYLSSKLLEETF